MLLLSVSCSQYFQTNLNTHFFNGLFLTSQFTWIQKCKQFLRFQGMIFDSILVYFQAGILVYYLLQVNNMNTRTKYEICSRVTINTPERISHLVLLFLLLAGFIYCFKLRCPPPFLVQCFKDNHTLRVECFFIYTVGNNE